jgi:ABC-type transport system involved in cytochrome c biogenesis permease subunit
MKYLLLIVMLLCAAPAMAQEKTAPLDYSTFREIPVLHEGRVKPMDSFARAAIGTLAGKDSLPGMSPSSWLAETLFDPANAIDRPVFRILRPAQLNLPLQDGKLYSYVQLANSLKGKGELIAKLSTKEEKDWSADQRELMDLYQKSVLFTQLLRSFSGILPLAIELPETLQKDWKIKAENAPRTLNDFRKFIPRVESRLKKIIAAKGDDLSRYTDDEKDIAAIGWQLELLETAGQQNVFFRIVPPQWEGDEWLSPWALTQSGKGSPDAATYMDQWAMMAQAWQAHDAAGWNDATRIAQTHVMAMKSLTIPAWKINLEIFYSGLHPMGTAMLCYLFAFIALIGATFRHRNTLMRAAFTAIILGTLTHAIGIALRIIILDRPPVGTLYESILFVSLVCVLGALAFERRLKDGSGLLIAALSGGLLLFTASAFAPDDTMQMLVAVLNTNFWLATHVLCITIGYGWCLVAAVMAHLYLINAVRGFTGSLDKLMSIIKTVVLCALLFTAVGTILGGIWADQSWGRFWGWDPKENGALLIVLWLIWLLHGRLSGQIKRLPFIAGTAFLSVIVALAWFGVNLLSTGLHSYGFIEGVALSLFAFCAVETAIISALWYKTDRKS